MSTLSSTTDISTGKEAVSSTDLAYVRPTLTRAHKHLLLWLFCGAEFMDAFIASALFPAINVLEKDLHISDANITWAFSAYSATFAAFLLISGRVADVYSARMCFIVGCVILGAFSLGGGFVHSAIPMFLLRAFAGVGAAMTVPSALSLIVEWFPEPSEQAQAISFFGGSSALGNGACYRSVVIFRGSPF
jgi:MFS family permease